MELTTKQLEGAHQATFLANEYTDKTVDALADMLMMPVIESTAAIWRAEDLKLLVVNDDTREVKVDRVPDDWQLGEGVANLIVTIPYVLERVARDKKDLTEEDLTFWTTGCLSHEYLIAMKILENNGVIKSYSVTTTNEVPVSKKGLKRGKKPKIMESTYIFWTLAENAEHEWGRNRFEDQSRLK